MRSGRGITAKIKFRLAACIVAAAVVLCGFPASGLAEEPVQEDYGDGFTQNNGMDEEARYEGEEAVVSEDTEESDITVETEDTGLSDETEESGLSDETEETGLSDETAESVLAEEADEPGLAEGAEKSGLAEGTEDYTVAECLDDPLLDEEPEISTCSVGDSFTVDGITYTYENFYLYIRNKSGTLRANISPYHDSDPTDADAENFVRTTTTDGNITDVLNYTDNGQTYHLIPVSYFDNALSADEYKFNEHYTSYCPFQYVPNANTTASFEAATGEASYYSITVDGVTSWYVRVQDTGSYSANTTYGDLGCARSNIYYNESESATTVSGDTFEDNGTTYQYEHFYLYLFNENDVARANFSPWADSTSAANDPTNFRITKMGIDDALSYTDANGKVYHLIPISYFESAFASSDGYSFYKDFCPFHFIPSTSYIPTGQSASITYAVREASYRQVTLEDGTCVWYVRVQDDGTNSVSGNDLGWPRSNIFYVGSNTETNNVGEKITDTNGVTYTYEYLYLYLWNNNNKEKADFSPWAKDELIAEDSDNFVKTYYGISDALTFTDTDGEVYYLIPIKYFTSAFSGEDSEGYVFNSEYTDYCPFKYIPDSEVGDDASLNEATGAAGYYSITLEDGTTSWYVCVQDTSDYTNSRSNIFYDPTGIVVFDMDGGNSTYGSFDTSGYMSTSLYYTVEFNYATGEVTINLPSDADLNKSFIVADNEGEENDVKATLEVEDTAGYKLVGWYDTDRNYYDVSGGSVTATVSMSDYNVFYAVWEKISDDEDDDNADGEDETLQPTPGDGTDTDEGIGSGSGEAGDGSDTDEGIGSGSGEAGDGS
ncbi:MAG: hypothetical protein LUC41_07135, partial [Clostridiales bacterium]|nr:hypothetical protein [Clostridiales bacterium]